MTFPEVKTKLLSLFSPDKLSANAEFAEHGFFNFPDTDYNGDKAVKKIGRAVNLTPEAIIEAAALNVDLIITHHDAWGFVFGMKEKCQALLKENNIASAFFHLPLDDADFGTSARLANALSLKNCYKTVLYEEIYYAGRIGELESGVAFERFAENLAKVLGEPIKAFKNNAAPIKKVCVVAGGGCLTDYVKVAVEADCNAYVTGEYNLYLQQYSKFAGINLLVGSHTRTEILGVEGLVNKLVEGTDIEVVRLSEENY